MSYHFLIWVVTSKVINFVSMALVMWVLKDQKGALNCVGYKSLNKFEHVVQFLLNTLLLGVCFL